MQAIRTRFHGPSNVKGARMSAKCEAGTIFVSYEHELNTDGNHARACRKLCEKLGWTEDGGYASMIGGQFAGDTYWVFDDGRLKAIKAYAAQQRAGTMSGSPWGHKAHRDLIACVGRAYGYYGDVLKAPRDDAEAAAMRDELDKNATGACLGE